MASPKSKSVTSMDNIYSLDGKVPLLKAIPFGLQHVLAMFVANIAPITTSLAKETNRPENLGVTVSTLNCLSYLAVAILGNCCGMLLDVFEPTRQGEYLVYSRHSYLLLFAVLSAIAVIPVVCSFFLKETRGQDCSETTF